VVIRHTLQKFAFPIAATYDGSMRRAVPILLVALLACGACGASVRTQALRTSLITLNIARDTLRATSREREKQIIDACDPPSCTKEEGHARLETWRGRVDMVAAAIDDGYDAIRDATILDDPKSAEAVGIAVARALALVKTVEDPARPPKGPPANEESTP
jgi:hypothetical protein